MAAPIVSAVLPDLSVPLLGVDRRAEVKCRGDGFRQLYGWLDAADFLIVKADRLEEAGARVLGE
jgi:hypothetical protein